MRHDVVSDSSSSARANKRILIVEDDSLLRRVYRFALGRAGFEVEEVGDGRSALERLAQMAGQIALVILDIGLPDIDGLELLAAIRGDHDDGSLPVIMITGADALDQRLEGLNGGANDYVVKPVAPAELVARVDTQLRTVGHWQAQVVAATHTGKQMALDLAEVAANQNLVAATNVIIRAATRVDGVDGAAFVVHGDTPNVIASFGEIPVVAGQTFPDRLGAQSHDLGTDRHTYSGGGRMEVIPLPDSAHPKGTIVVSLAPGSKTRCTEAVTSIADLAAIAAPILTPMLDREHALETRRLHYGQMIEDLTFDTVFQPIVDLTTRVPVGYEALTRFADGTRPDLAFADAAAVGLRCALEKSAARTAVVRADALPTKAYVSVNLSASTAVDTDFLEELVSGQREVVVEITEHDAIEDYEQVADALATVRDRARLALDDTGAGYAGLTHLRSLRPDVIKLDRALVRGLHLDPVGRAMVAGLVHFARETGTSLVGEGVETEAELRTLIDLGLTLGQGYLLGVPAPIPGPALLAAA